MIRTDCRRQCPSCGSYNTYSWRGQGTLDMESYFECYDCGFINDDGEIKTKKEESSENKIVSEG